MANTVVIIDHGLSNLSSISRAIEECGGNAVVTDDPHALSKANRIILPGVGAFPSAMANMQSKGLIDALLLELTRRPIPLLGICLGMQLLALSSTEEGLTGGLGLIPGKVERLKPISGERIPHMGWNEVNFIANAPLFKEIPLGTDFYFVHSYCLSCPDENVVARTPYCGSFVSAAAQNNVMAVQFHPEKSQRAGFQLLRNFLSIP